MRRILGLLILLYGLLLALNTAAPSLAKAVGEKVQASLSGDAAACKAPLGKPPYGGHYGSCPATWSGSHSGHVFGDDVRATLLSGQPVEAYQYPMLTDFAVLPPSNSDQVAAIISALLVLLGALMLGTERRHRRARMAGDGDDDFSDGGDSSYDSDSGGGGDSGSDGGGGDGGGGGD